MTEEELDALYAELETALVPFVQEQLDVVAAEFAERVDAATELVAAAFSVSSIREMWRRRVPRIMARLRQLATRSAAATAENLGEPVPQDDELDPVIDPYLSRTEPLVASVGDNLARAAVTSLEQGVAAGEDLDQLKARMLTVFDDQGAQLGPVRAQRIARTEATRAWNAGVQAAAEALQGPQRPLVKQWRTVGDERVRQEHRDADGQLRLLSEAFDVGGFPMLYPGDPSAPADLTIECRCRMRATAPVADEGNATVDDDLSAAADVQTGAMIALVPSEADARRMALPGGEAEGQLHLTLCYLGDADQWPEHERDEVRERMRAMAAQLCEGGPLYGRAFGAAQWNPFGDDPAWVWNIGDDSERTINTLAAVHSAVTALLEVRHGEAQIPPQFTPWAPHVCGAYGQDDWREEMAERCGPVVFDRIRVAFAGENWDYPLYPEECDEMPEDDELAVVHADEMPTTAAWSTPGDTALAFENQQTGDGRVFAPGALYWDGDGPWPLQYADEMQGGHDGAQLAGAIESISRDGDRITGTGVLYLSQNAGWEAASLLAQGAPLGVSVDLDDVDMEVIDATAEGQAEAYRVKLLTASVMVLPGGSWSLTGETAQHIYADSSGGGMGITSRRITMFSDTDGSFPAAALVAAAGDPDVDGMVLDRMNSGDYLMRITRGRVRGATLVTIPAYAAARIELQGELWADARLVAAAAEQSSDYTRVLRHVRRAKAPVGAAVVARSLGINVTAARRYLNRAANDGEVVRIARGLYTDHTTLSRYRPVSDVSTSDVTASVTGAVDLPVASRDVEWDGDEAKNRVFEWADGDADKIADAFAYRDDDADPLTKAAYKLGYTDVRDGNLVIIPRGVSAALGAVHGARGGVDLPQDEQDGVRERLEAVQRHVDEELGADSMDSMEASAWRAMADLPPMPAEWFREPTPEELPTGGPGVNYTGGRIFGWVAQKDVPHAGYAKRVVINDLGRIDTTHFLRQRFELDDGTTVKAGAFTMNVGHHRDGAECETSACQFDDTRTVAGIVTVGMRDGGMWFSGAAAPWLSEWDRTVFMGTQPSYHMKKGNDGRWQLRAVLAVPVPGHSSPLLASAVVERAQLALTAAATMVEIEDAVVAEEQRQAAGELVRTDEEIAAAAGIDYDRLADAMVAAMARAEQQRQAEENELAELLAAAAEMDDKGN